MNNESDDGSNEKHDRKPPVRAERTTHEQHPGARRPHGLPEAGKAVCLPSAAPCAGPLARET
ncbi:hypothetical protein [Halomonas sp. KO116]|uniref:hypothetical protein n=1 Tax=Halomonas sp. KO116 TaxID=1504981 RepID=UPI0005F871BC|nr:hypothetical protein [Halomonas sp. KO116]